MINKKLKFKKKYLILLLLVVPIIISLLTKNPQGTSIKSNWYDVSDLEFINDLTYVKDGEIIHDQTIIDKEIEIINSAEKYIIVDMFLFNDEYDKEQFTYPNNTEKMSQALIKKKSEIPNIDITFITDPINNFYGSYEQEALTNMREAGINVVVTDLSKLKDSNPILSGYWRCYVQWFGQKGLYWINNPAEDEAPNVNLRSMLNLANFKGNHRKVVVTEKEAIVSSANPHDSSGYHSNIAFKFKSYIINDIIESEKTVANFSKNNINDLKYNYDSKNKIDDTKIRLLTEKEIYYSLKENIDRMDKDDKISICVFYLSDFDIIKSLISAGERGVDIKLMLDPNKDAFGIKSHGLPNRPAITNMIKKSNNTIKVKWYDTNGEQFHTKMAIFEKNGIVNIIGGSANYTRRNIKGYNLETDIEIQTTITNEIAIQINEYFNKLWNNTNATYTVDFDKFKDDSTFKYIIYILQEATGLCTF